MCVWREGGREGASESKKSSHAISCTPYNIYSILLLAEETQERMKKEDSIWTNNILDEYILLNTDEGFGWLWFVVKNYKSWGLQGIVWQI